MWPFRRKERSVGLEEAREARHEAELRLAAAQREIIVPLREMHRENHIQPMITALIARRARERRHDRNGPAPG